MRTIYIISLFPAMLQTSLNTSMLKKAQDKQIVNIEYLNLRDFGLGKRKSVDDVPYGGGDGMLLMVEPMFNALMSIKQKDPDALVILPTPRGKTYLQSDALNLAQKMNNLIIICPRYEGYDQRITHWVDLEFSIGNYVLTGGEIPAMVIVDSIVRLLPGVLGGENSAKRDSFFNDDKSIEYPQYTRPEVFQGLKVPKVLLSGHHQKILDWQNKHER